jgi:hypothetical protein
MVTSQQEYNLAMYTSWKAFKPARELSGKGIILQLLKPSKYIILQSVKASKSIFL